MESRANYTLVGIFISIFSFALLSFIFWLGKYGYKDEVFDYYKIYVRDSVSGLHKESSVKFRGVYIGTVDKIEINPKNSEEIEVIIKTKRDTPIKEDNYAVIKSQGLTGLSYIELNGGSRKSPKLQTTPMDMAIIKSQKSIFSKLENSAENITDKMETILAKVDLLLTEKNINSIENIISNINLLLNKNSIDKIGNIIANLEEVTTKLKNQDIDIDGVLHKSTKTLASIDTTSKDFKLQWKKLMSKFINSLDRGDYNVKEMSKESFDKLNELLNEFKLLTYSAEDLIDDIKLNPSNLIFKSTSTKYGPGE